MSYYHDARAQVKKLKQDVDDNRRRAERRAEVAGLQVDFLPGNMLVVEGRSCKLYKNAEQHAAIEAQEGLIPWNKQPDHLIDRFDGRAMLDFYKEPDERALNRPKSSEEQRLEQVLRFEAFRDAVLLDSKGYSEDVGLKVAEKLMLEHRAAQRVAAAAAVAAAQSQRQHSQANTTPAGHGSFAAVGFSYTSAADTAASSSSEDEDDADVGEEGPEEAEDERVDALAEGFGVDDFAYRLQRAMQAEGAAEELARLRPKRRMSRKKRLERQRRSGNITAQLYGPHTAPSANSHILPPPPRGDAPLRPPPRRTSPAYHARRGSRSKSRSPSPNRLHAVRPRTEFITTFGTSDARSARDMREEVQPSWMSLPSKPADASLRFAGGILDALPDAPDPAQRGAQQFPKEAADLQIARIVEQQAEQERMKRMSARELQQLRERKEREAAGAGVGMSSWGRGHISIPAHEPAGRSNSREHQLRSGYDRHDREWDRERSLEGRHVEDRRGEGRHERVSGRGSSDQRSGSGRSGQQGTGHPASAASAPSAAPAAAKETPQERLKRIMQTQLKSTAAKDNLAATQKKLQVAKEMHARASMAVAGQRRSPSPPTYYREQSKSPARHSPHRHSYRRSRSRSR